ncbi:MAG: prolipoprotein diacylglyceryl transferase, partial [Flavobacteriales bacterium]
QKAQLTSPLKETREIWPSDFAGNITMYSALFGFAGAKLFHLIENPSEFVQFFSNPSVESFISGLTVYGGLIFGSMGVLIYARSKKIPLRRLCDAAAPAMIIGYGIGRIGCQVSGDGDWGIANPHPQPAYLAWMPGWLWAYDYPNNVNHDARYEGYLGPLNDTYVEKITDPKVPCYEGYCTHLVPPVYPTPVYETFMATVIFAILWLLRRKLKIPGQLFALYLILNGCERFLIEQIRVNNKFELLGMIWTQAELIAVGFIATGFGLMAFLSRDKRPQTQLSQDGQQN